MVNTFTAASGTNYYGATIFATTPVEQIDFAPGLAVAKFAASQFNNSQISSSVVIFASSPADTEVVEVAMNAFDGSFSIAGWSFLGFVGEGGTDGPDQVHIVGSSAPDIITGNDQSGLIEVIEGGLGTDELHGGGANDVFVYSNPGDIEPGEVISGGGGSNSIRLDGVGSSFDFTGAIISSVTELDIVSGNTSATFTGSQIQMAGITLVADEFSLGDETLIVNGSSVNLSGVTFQNWSASDRVLINGTTSSDMLIGAAVSNIIDGGPGNDSLVGGAGADRFVFDTALNKLTNVDHIANFQQGIDKIALSRHIFGANLAVNVHTFHAAHGAKAGADADDRIVYNKTTGALYFDKDGAGGAAAIKFAVLDAHPANLSPHDFVLVA